MAETLEGTPLNNFGPETASLGKSTAEQLEEAKQKLRSSVEDGGPELVFDTVPGEMPELVVPEWGDFGSDEEAVEAPAPVPAPSKSDFERRLETAAERAGISMEDYVHAVEALADAPPAPQMTVDEEVGARLGSDPNYVALYNAAQDPANFSTEMERLLAIQMLTNATNTTRQAVTTERQLRQTAETTAAQVAREQIDELAADPQFAPFLRTREDREALRKYARQTGLTDLKTAAKAHLFDKAFQAGRTTQTRARKASVDRGRASDGSLPRPAGPAPDSAVVKQGLWAFTQHMKGGRKK